MPFCGPFPAGALGRESVRARQFLSAGLWRPASRPASGVDRAPLRPRGPSARRAHRCRARGVRAAPGKAAGSRGGRGRAARGIMRSSPAAGARRAADTGPGRPGRARTSPARGEKDQVSREVT